MSRIPQMFGKECATVLAPNLQQAPCWLAYPKKCQGHASTNSLETTNSSENQLNGKRDKICVSGLLKFLCPVNFLSG